MRRNYVKLGGDFSEILDVEVINNLLKTNDIIGSVLRIHFMCEKLVVIWCSKVTDTNDLFEKTGNMPFTYKLKIAKNLGLPDEIHQVISKINGFRNSFAHKTNSDLSEQQLLDLYHHVNHVSSCFEQPIGNVDDPDFRIGLGEGEVLYWNQPDITKNHKLLLLYANFAIKTMGLFQKEFENKGISSSYIDYPVTSLPNV